MSPFTPRGGNPCVNRSDVMPMSTPTGTTSSRDTPGGRDAEGFICRLACAHFGAGEGET